MPNHLSSLNSRSVASPGQRLGRPCAVPRARRGGMALQFAMLVPLVWCVFYLCFENCRVSLIPKAVESAVYSGCRTAASAGSTTAQVRQQTEQQLLSLGISKATIKVIPAVLDDSVGEVTVRVEVPVAENSFLLGHAEGCEHVVRELTMNRQAAATRLPNG